MNIASIAVDRPIGTLMIAFAVVVIGVVSFSRLAVDLLPSMDAPQLTIVTTYPGVAPEEIETLLTRPIEQVVSTVEGVDELSAQSTEGLSRVRLRFNWGHDIQTALDDVRALIDRVRARLPEEADPPIVYKFDLAQAPIAALGLSGTGDPRRLRYLAEEVLSRRLERVTGVAAVDIRGGRVREIEVRLEAERLAALGIDAADVSAALARENRDTSAGDMLKSGREVIIRVEGELTSAADVAAVVLGSREGRPIHVSDVAQVVDGFQEQNAELWVDGHTAIQMRVSKQSGTNTIEVAEALKAEVDAINADYDGRLTLTVIQDGSTFISASVTNVESSALYGAALAVLILLFFLRNVRATFVIATAIPISILATFALMYSADISLNVISLGGLALGVGMVVDGAIVILENTYRRLEDGEPPRTAAIEGSREVMLAVAAGTLTTVAVFVPVVFIEGFAGVFFREMALVVSFALACSLVVAFTVVPALCGLVIRARKEDHHGVTGWLRARAGAFLGAVDGAYVRALDAALQRPALTLVLAVALLVGSFSLIPLIGVELMPQTDEGEVDVELELPVGTPIETTIETMKRLEARVLSVLEPGELDHVTTAAGPEAAWRPVTSNQGDLEMTLVPASERRRSLDQIIAAIRAATSDMPGADIRVRPRSSNLLLRLMRGGGDRLVVEVRGHDLEIADRLAERVELAMNRVDGVTDTFIEREPGKAEQTIHLDRARLAELGLTGAAVASAVEHYVLGKVTTRLRDGGAEYDIRVRLRAQDRRSVEQLHALPVPLPSGRSVPLGAVARLEEGLSPASISRLNQERVLQVGAGTTDRPLGDIVRDVALALESVEVPEGFSLALTGEQAEQEETFGGLLVGVLLAIFLVYAVLVVQYESLRQPLVVMTAVPFSIIGVVAALLISGTTFNMNSFLGVIVLVGIVVNNAILLVDYANRLRADEGMSIGDALRLCGRRRLRPVLMTTGTTMLGMLPLALAPGEGSEIQAPLARAVVGGLFVSTVVTLVVVPVLYSLIEDAVARRASRKTGASPVP